MTDAESRIVSEDLRQYGLKPTCPKNVWDLLDQQTTLRIKSIKSWIIYMTHPSTEGVRILTDGDKIELRASRMSDYKNVVWKSSISAITNPEREKIVGSFAHYPKRGNPAKRVVMHSMIVALLPFSVDGKV